MLSLDVDVSDLIAAADQLDRDVKAALVTAVDDAKTAGVVAAKQNSPRRTGELIESIHANQATGGAGDVVLGEIVADAPHAKIVADGSKPHEIAAKGGALAFPFAGSALFFRRKVQHPGTKPNAYMVMGENAARSELGSTLVTEVEAAAAKFNG